MPTREEERERRRKLFAQKIEDDRNGIMRVDLSLPHRQQLIALGKALTLREITQLPLGQVEGPRPSDQSPQEPDQEPENEFPPIGSSRPGPRS